MAFTMRDFLIGVSKSAPGIAESIYQYQDRKIQERQLANQEAQTTATIEYYGKLGEQIDVSNEESRSLIKSKILAGNLANQYQQLMIDAKSLENQQLPEDILNRGKLFLVQMERERAQIQNFSANTANINLQNQYLPLLNEMELQERNLNAFMLISGSMTPDDWKIFSPIVDAAPKDERGGIDWLKAINLANEKGVLQQLSPDCAKNMMSLSNAITSLELQRVADAPGNYIDLYNRYMSPWKAGDKKTLAEKTAETIPQWKEYKQAHPDYGVNQLASSMAQYDISMRELWYPIPTLSGSGKLIYPVQSPEPLPSTEYDTVTPKLSKPTAPTQFYDEYGNPLDMSGINIPLQTPGQPITIKRIDPSKIGNPNIKVLGAY